MPRLLRCIVGVVFGFVLGMLSMPILNFFWQGEDISETILLLMNFLPAMFSGFIVGILGDEDSSVLPVFVVPFAVAVIVAVISCIVTLILGVVYLFETTNPLEAMITVFIVSLMLPPVAAIVLIVIPHD